MAELRILCPDPDFLQQLVEPVLAERLRLIEEGIQKTEARIKKFESKFNRSTDDFLRQFNNNQIQHRSDMEFDEWIGEFRMLKTLREKAEKLRGIQFVN